MLLSFIAVWSILSIVVAETYGCPENWIDCGNSRCVARFWHCDGENDCGNMKDEENCEREPFECQSSQFQCSKNNCIPAKWVCDGEHDCVNGADEMKCDNTSCDGFKCENNVCIPSRWRCDGQEDCISGTDEILCDKKTDEKCSNIKCGQTCTTSSSGACNCSVGYRLSRDHNCIDIDECQEDGFCSHICSNEQGSYTCDCMKGYSKKNRTCLAGGEEPLLVFASLEDIRAIYLRSEIYFPVHKAVSRSTAVDVDPKDSRVYWTDLSTNGSAIYSSYLDGSGFRTVINKGLRIAEDLAIDFLARNIYISDSGVKQIIVCKIDGSVCSVLHSDGVDKPRALALNPSESLLYWSEWGEFAGIHKSGMDGTQRSSLVSTDIKWPNGIAIDPTTNRLYWCDAQLYRLEFITLDGKKRKVILQDAVFHPYALTVFEDSLYWTDWATFTLGTCNKFTGHNQKVIARENGKHIMGLHIYHPLLTSTDISNPCWMSLCSHLCLISEHGKYRCVCPPGFALHLDQVTCSIDEKSPQIFISDGSRVYHVQPDAVGMELITKFAVPVLLIGDIAYNKNLRIMYISDVMRQIILQFHISTFGSSELVNSRIGKLESLAYDDVGDNLYWVDSSRGTVEAVAIITGSRVEIITNLSRPLSLALDTGRRVMFISEFGGLAPTVVMYNMDGRYRKVLSLTSFPAAMSVHPENHELFWGDPRTETIESIDSESNERTVHRRNVSHMTSIAVSSKHVYWMDSESNKLFVSSHNQHVQAFSIPRKVNEKALRKVIYVTVSKKEISPCTRDANDGCTHICLLEPSGYTCKCPIGMQLTKSKCLVSAPSPICEKGKFSCGDGQCVPFLWHCDGEKDCNNSFDEVHCNSTRCARNQHRCDHGQCIPSSWSCDGTSDCFDGTDERVVECGLSESLCQENEFRCGSAVCIDSKMICDHRIDCEDSSDERNCVYNATCKSGMFRCNDGTCIYHHEVCDGHQDCDNDENHMNCTKTCASNEFYCSNTKRCIPVSWLCDGDDDCLNGADEELHFCRKSPSHAPRKGESCDKSNGGCSQLCSPFAQGLRCSCLTGYKLMPDNKTCADENECLNPGLCSQYCSNTKGGFKCSCAKGYFLTHDHRKCKADGGSASLVYLLPDQIRGLDLNSHSNRVYFEQERTDMRGLDYDVSDGVFFWSDWEEGTISSYDISSKRVDILIHDLQRPYFLKCDWIAKNIYYTNSEGSILACTRNGSYCVTVTTTEDMHINSFDIAPESGMMFWSVWSEIRKATSGLVERANMDGSEKVTVLADKIYWPTSVTVDHILDRIYWTDIKLNTLETSDFYGLSRRIVVKDGMYYPFSMAVFEDYVFWADWGTDSIFRCNKFSGTDCLQLHRGDVKAEIMIVVHKVGQPKGLNHCLNNHCSQICLQKPFGFSCGCNEKLKKKNSSCLMKWPVQEEGSQPLIITAKTHTFTPAAFVRCFKGYCYNGGECKLIGFDRVCWCLENHAGDRCEITPKMSFSSSDYSWIVAALLAIFSAVAIVTVILIYRQNRIKMNKLGDTFVVSFKNPRFAFHKKVGLVTDTDDAAGCDKLMPEKPFDIIDGFGNPLFNQRPYLDYSPHMDYSPWLTSESQNTLSASECKMCDGSQYSTDFFNIFQRSKYSSHLGKSEKI